MPKWIDDALTETNNHTYDIVRILALTGAVQYLGLNLYEVIHMSKDFDMLNFGIGLGSVFAGVGVALKLKPETKSDQDATSN